MTKWVVWVVFALLAVCLGLLVVDFFGLTRFHAIEDSTAAIHRAMAQAVCRSLDQYGQASSGSVPTLSALVEKDESLAMTARDLGFRLQSLPETFEVVPLPNCIHEGGHSAGGYVVVVKKVPDRLTWRIVFVNGQEVKL